MRPCRRTLQAAARTHALDRTGLLLDWFWRAAPRALVCCAADSYVGSATARRATVGWLLSPLPLDVSCYTLFVLDRAGTFKNAVASLPQFALRRACYVPFLPLLAAACLRRAPVAVLCVLHYAVRACFVRWMNSDKVRFAAAFALRSRRLRAAAARTPHRVLLQTNTFASVGCLARITPHSRSPTVRGRTHGAHLPLPQTVDGVVYAAHAHAHTPHTDCTRRFVAFAGSGWFVRFFARAAACTRLVHVAAHCFAGRLLRCGLSPTCLSQAVRCHAFYASCMPHRPLPCAFTCPAGWDALRHA